MFGSAFVRAGVVGKTARSEVVVMVGGLLVVLVVVVVVMVVFRGRVRVRVEVQGC